MTVATTERPKRGSPEAKARDLERRMKRAREKLGKGASETECRRYVEQEQARDGERLQAARRAAHDARLAEARITLGPEATPSDLEVWVSEQAKKKRKAASKKATEKTKAAGRAVREAHTAIKEAALADQEAPVYAPDPDDNLGSRAALRGDPDFDRADDGLLVSTVRVTRMASTKPEHNLPGVEEGEVFTFPYDRGRLQEIIKFKRGGGRYQAEAIGVDRRVAQKVVIDIPGKAKPTPTPDDEAEEATAPVQSPYFLYGNGSRLPADLPPWMAPPPARDDRIERLERLVERLAEKPATPAVDYEAKRRYEESRDEARRDREETLRREQEAREERYRRDREAREEKFRERELEDRRAADARQSQTFDTLLKVIASRPKDDGNAAAMQALAAVTGSFTGLATGMLDTVSAAASGEDSRSVVERIMEKMIDNVGPMLTGLKDIAQQIGKPGAAPPPPQLAAPPPRPAPPPPTSPVVLADGRSIALVHVQKIILEFEGEFGRKPTDEELFSTIAGILDDNPHLNLSPVEDKPEAAPEPEPAEEAPVPAPTNGRWASPTVLYRILRHFQAQADAREALDEMLERGDLSEQACVEIGAIYRKHAHLTGALVEVFALLTKRRIPPLAGFLEAFQKDPRGSQWLSDFLGAAGEAAGQQRAEAA